MKKTRFSLYGIMAMFIVMIMLSACSGSLDSQWIQTTDGALFWASPADTTMSYSWEGETFDSIANGKGTLSKIDTVGNSLPQQFNMFYGATSDDAENGGYPPTQNGDIRSLFWLFSLMALQN